MISMPLLRNTLLWLCVVLPWLNPLTSPPSTSVLPLLLSWLLSACALLLVADLPMPAQRRLQQPAFGLRREVLQGLLGLVILGVAASLLSVPQVMDIAATAGLVAALVCMGAMAWVGRRMAWQPNGLMAGLVVAWLSAAVISSMLGILQYLDMASGFAPWVNQPPFKGDAFANLRQRNQFASLTSIGLVALLAGTYALMQTPSAINPLAARQPRLVTSVAFVLLNVLAIGAACSMSRTGLLQWVAVSVLALLWAWRQKAHTVFVMRAWWWLALCAPLLLVVWSFVMPLVSQHITGQQGASLAMRVAGSAQDYGVCASRSVLWRNVLQLIAQKPMLGWGWGETDLAHFLTPYTGQRFCDILDNAHNLPLHLALEFGVPLAVCMALLVVAWLWPRQPWRERSVWRVMAWGVLLVVGLHSLLEYPLWYGPFQMAVGLSVGLLWALPSHNGEFSQVPHASYKVSEASALLVASLFFFACLYAAWDYNRVSQIYKPVHHRDPAFSHNPLAFAKQSLLFRNQAEFADLTLQQVTAGNAQSVYDQAQRVVHYSPEARVVQQLIDSARLLGHDEEAEHWTARLTAHQQAMQR